MVILSVFALRNAPGSMLLTFEGFLNFIDFIVPYFLPALIITALIVFIWEISYIEIFSRKKLDNSKIKREDVPDCFVHII